MNHWLTEYAAEARRIEILAQLEQIRLARQARAPRPALYNRSMLRLADWMISAGRDLRCRYGLRSVDCNRPAAGSLIR